MRMLIVGLVFLVSVSARATEGSPDATAPNVSPDATEPSVSDTPLWTFDYEHANRTARTGTTLGNVGAVSILAGAAMMIAGSGTGAGINDTDEPGGRLIVAGLITGGVGLLSVQVGAPVAAVGASMARRALVEGGQAEAGCPNCVVAVLLGVPNPFSLFTVPASYVVSASVRRSNQVRYHRYKGLGPPQVRASPKGVGLTWTF